MNTMTVKRKKFRPFLQSQKNRILFKVIMRCIPGFILGISSGIIYFVGYQSMISEQQDKKHSHAI